MIDVIDNTNNLIYSNKKIYKIADQTIRKLVKLTTVTIDIINRNQLGNTNVYKLGAQTTNTLYLEIKDSNSSRRVLVIQGTRQQINKIFEPTVKFDKDFTNAVLNLLITSKFCKLTNNKLFNYVDQLISTKTNKAITAKSNTLKKSLRIIDNKYCYNKMICDLLKLKYDQSIIFSKQYAIKQYKKDKELIFDKRFNLYKIYYIISKYRVYNKDWILVNHRTNNNKQSYLYDKIYNKKINILELNKWKPLQVLNTDWNSTLTQCTINLTNKYKITFVVDSVTVSDGGINTKYPITAFAKFYSKKTESNWRETLKDDTTVIKHFIDNLPTTVNTIKHVLCDGNKFETTYQQLSVKDQYASATIFSNVDKFLKTADVDNLTLIMYYLCCNRPVSKRTFFEIIL